MTTFQRLAHGSQRPFVYHPRADRYFPASSPEEARGRLSRSIERGDGLAMLIGAAGTGKSLLLRVLAEQFDDKFAVVYLACGQLDKPRDLLQAILFELGLPYRVQDIGELRLALLDHLHRSDRWPGCLLLLIDEAHTLPVPLLEELRMLTNVIINGEPRAQIVLAGAPILEEQLASPELESFSQRLSARCYLAPMNHQETVQYVRAHLSIAEVDADQLFDSDAFDAVYEATDGVPRLVNQLCDNTMLMADQQDASRVSRQMIHQAWSDLQQLPTPWTTEPAGLAGQQHQSRDPDGGVLEFGSLTPEHATGADADVYVEEIPDDESGDDFAILGFAGRRGEGPVYSEDESAESAELVEPAEDPFDEEFAEEEMIFDAFASIEQIINPNAPRVENRREANVASLVAQTLEKMGKPADWSSSTAESTGDSSDIPDEEAVIPGDGGASPGVDANVAASRQTIQPPGQVTVDAGEPIADTVVIIEDSPVTDQPAATADRPSYRQLFARLRGR